MATDITTIKNWFKTGLKPTQSQFWATWDSYWHKDESISISNIENLENVLNNKADNTHEHSQYATNDATSLTEANIISWQKALKISDLKFDDKAITVTQDYSDFGLQVGATINSFNNAIYQTVRNKLDAPTEEGTTENYPYVVGVNDENEPIKLPAGDLGKNFSNTDLVVSSTRKHTGTSTVEFGMPLVFSNAVQQFKNLADKSSDATFNALMGLDSNGNAGKLTALGNVLESGLKGVSSDQALRIGQLLNGGSGSAGAISVNLISPPLFELENNNVYIVLRGSNLFLNSNSMEVAIVNPISNKVLATVPNSQVQLYSDGLSLVFYYNFSTLGIGEYKIRLTSGTKILYTTLKFSIVQKVESILPSEITWEALYDTSIYTDGNTSGGNGYSANTTSMGKTALASLPTVSVKSNQLFSQGEDFMIEFNLTTGNAQTTSNRGYFFRIGICYSSSENTLKGFLPIHYIEYNRFHTSGGNRRLSCRIFNSTERVVLNSINEFQVTIPVAIIKQGNTVTINDGVNTSIITISNNSGYSLVLQQVNTDQPLENPSIQITKIFKFN